jgi:hypothetical protein
MALVLIRTSISCQTSHPWNLAAVDDDIIVAYQKHPKGIAILGFVNVTYDYNASQIY